MLSKRCLGTLLFKLNNVRYHSINVAVVGSGPAGFYTTQKLLKNPAIKVDIYEKLPVPFGLIRYGVAPDHPEVKNVINSFTSVANSDRVNFYGNVSLGDNIKLDDLIDSYHAVVLCYGSAQDRMLNIEGEQTTENTISARNFVGWYNGVPEDRNLKINLDCDTACIVGQGNVALDCARILLRPNNLEKTDITSYAQQRIAKSCIRRIYILGRRGPVQVSFTTKELREILKMNENHTRIEPADILKTVNMEKIRELSRQRRRLTELMLSSCSTSQKEVMSPSTSGDIELIFKFMSKPHRIVGDPKTRQVSQLELRKTLYESDQAFMDEKAHPVDLDEYETIECGLIIRSIGYKAVMIDQNLPVNHKLGAILNTDGRIHGHRNLYCSGWLATGATGVVAGTLSSSTQTARSILDDIENKELPNLAIAKKGYERVGMILLSKSIQVVHFNDWLRIDELERKIGESIGKTREKFADIAKLLEIARGASSP